jgi:hypothetical protein
MTPKPQTADSLPIFGKQSGQIKAVRLDLSQILEETRRVFEEIKSDPPPPESLFPVAFVGGAYRVIQGTSDHPELTDKVEIPPNLRLKLFRFDSKKKSK